MSKVMKLCCFFNYNPHYRWPIYHAMDKELNCDFYFGDSVFQNIKQFDAKKLRGFRGFLHTNKLYHGYRWHKGVNNLLKKEYSHYLLTGEYPVIANWIVGLYAKLKHKKVYYWMHGKHSPGGAFRSNLINRIFYKLADGIFLYGEYAIPFMEKEGCKRENMYIIHNSLDTDVQTKMYNMHPASTIYKEHFGNDYSVVIYIGRLQKRKKIDQLIDAIEILKLKNKKVNLVIVGPKEDDETLMKLVQKKGLNSQIWFYGECYDEETTAKLLYNADVCVCPAAVGLTAIHSLSYGTPVVSNDNYYQQMPEHEAIVDDVTGSFFRADDEQSLAENIAKWCDLSVDMRQKTREEARKMVLENWSVNYQICMLKKIIQ